MIRDMRERRTWPGDPVQWSALRYTTPLLTPIAPEATPSSQHDPPLAIEARAPETAHAPA